MTAPGEVPGWTTVIDGLNEVSRKIYDLIFERFVANGFADCLADGPLSFEELAGRFGVDPAVHHRFRVALGGLRAIGAVALDGDRVTLLRATPDPVEVEDELIATVFGPTMLGGYLEIYARDQLLNPDFALTFEGEQSVLWEGLLNAPVNTVGSDQAIRWIGRPGARVLELAFGPGSTIPKLLDVVGDAGSVAGVDASAFYVEQARARFADDPRVGDLVELDINRGLDRFPDGSFDGVMFMGALQFIESPAILFAELARIVTARGKLVLGAFHTTKPCFSNPALHLHMNLFDPPAFEFPVADVQRWLHDVGFETNITVEFGSYCTLYAERLPDVVDGWTRT